ncbi:hypothetical protein [Actinophytocola oryzae]|uniref:Right handed beta helix domain-containing protein n=1 Tax=Actinophytocola oryzae TaxID=502181 RepID=A0A4R7UU01_9PSEU|nr:hypothetical protein [Actinophytocola oryzae]TDV40143.1 hypothetical protein CLV71_124162 [Actinophytocola oryzae]
MSRIDENELRTLFEEIEAPPGLDRWRERIADVDAEAVEQARHDLEATEDEEHESHDAVVVPLPADGGFRPRHRRRSVAVAAAAAVVVGLGGLVVTTQLFSDSPPADPPMIIDAPDRTDTTAPPPTPRTSGTSEGVSTPPSGPGSNQSQPPPAGPGGVTTGGGGGPVGNDQPIGSEPAWPAMVGDPTAANTGVPLGASLGDRNGDLRITTPNQVVSDLRVNGSVIVDAPGVTLKRVLIVAPYGVPAVRQNATGLTIVDSELSGGTALTQGAAGLTVRRSRLEAGVTVTSGAQVVDCFLDGGNVIVPSGSTSVLLRHNTFGQVTMSDLDAPIRGVTIENNLLAQVDAPTGAGSASIYVTGNRFHGTAPSTGWNSSATDYRWSGNVFADSGAPAQP